MSTRSLTAFALGCALGFLIAFVALRSAQSPTLTAAPSDEQIGPRVKEILSGEDPLRRITELSALLSTLGPTAAPALVAAFDAAPLDVGDPELVLLGMWWARSDPQGAFAWTTSEWRARSATVIAAVFRTGAHSDPKLAFSTAQGLPFARHREVGIDAAIVGWDESGQPGLIETLAELPDVDLQPLAGSVARRRVVALGAAGAFRWAETLADPRLHRLMEQRVASASAESPEGAPLAAAWATPKVRSDDRISTFPRRIATRWVVHDAKAAMAWLATLPAGADRDDGVAEGFGEWMRSNEIAASAWIEAIERERWNEPALSFYARSIGRRGRSKEAVELAQRITDPTLRETTLIAIGRRWIRQDRAAAETWLAQPGVPERVRRLSEMAGGGARAPKQAQAEPNAMTGAVPD